ncbi:CU044_5270 family protein [Actinoallomurus purpureus]|uniref:CU044_5270 family protein n=1 Tax=Actinoallomurus purpureus TaxID=478114 RepID=UPI002093BFD5|nr:CU044_5270 family protein [Actinoallomurus purpureus]MCO6004365.1 CU044_5270 family protein [Actinoallomurus purpureus]
MDELELLRRGYDRIGPPRQEVLDAAEARLHDAVRAERGSVRRGRRMALRFAAAAMGTAAIATALTWSQDEDPARRPVANAAELARRAETRSRSEPAVAVRPNQWAYVKRVTRGLVGGPKASEFWTRMDGRRAPGVHLPPLPSAMVLAELPDRPDAALARLYTEVDHLQKLLPERDRAPAYAGIANSPRDQAVFRLATLLLEYYCVPPRVQATLYGALSRVPGVGVLPDEADAAGRHGVALFAIKGSLRIELVLDRRTYRYLGARDVSIDDGTARRTRPETLWWTAQLSAALVERPGEHP